MNINTVTFVAPNWACGRRERRIPQTWGCHRPATKPQSNSAQPSGRRSFLAQASGSSLQTAQGYLVSLAPRPAPKSLAANDPRVCYVPDIGSRIAAPKPPLLTTEVRDPDPNLVRQRSGVARGLESRLEGGVNSCAAGMFLLRDNGETLAG